ncbi:unnamed protein product [Eruca vesicaria subsp. sativa]|uniref:Uncharacterized protein n=1 Tax=Eruca vesicaria subsp. sativa TaxID=29727 RepID=A0ABC8J5J1_ERUVS|nr:unnamed protein product [Eruca vesicaria subsp. sativa]
MKMNKKLSVIELLKQAVKLLLSNINLPLIIFLCSLPLFCFLIVFELFHQTTLSFTYHSSPNKSTLQRICHRTICLCKPPTISLTNRFTNNAIFGRTCLKTI